MQIEFENTSTSNNKKYFGGSLLKGNAREKRPMSKGSALHIVLRSDIAKGSLSLLHPKRAKTVEKIVYKFSKKFAVNVYRYANSGNHLHLLIRPYNRYAYRNYIKTITGLIARITLQAERGRAKGLKLWSVKPFSRIVQFGRDYKGVCNYIAQNILEALDLIAYRPRKKVYYQV
jgi:REP element-mobilizing transposase RayT